MGSKERRAADDRAKRKQIADNENDVIEGGRKAAAKQARGEKLTDREKYVKEVADDIVERRAGSN